MASANNSSQLILQTFRYVEWSLIAVCFLTSGFLGRFGVSIEQSLHIGGFYIGLVILSFAFPINRPFWVRQLYILLGIGLTFSLWLTGVVLTSFIFLYIAKSYFLLDRKYLPLTVIAIGIAAALMHIWAIPAINQASPYCTIDPNKPEQVQQLLVNFIGGYTALSSFAILLCWAISAEQKSRKRAEALALEVETLAATLERTRIARDIHDSLGHTLTNLQVHLAVAQKLKQRDPDKSSQAIDTAKILADQCVEDVSRSLSTMRQSDFDLNQALLTLMEQLRQTQSLKIQSNVNLPNLPLHTTHQIYSILKEGLINIQKHARASHICLRSRTSDREITLELEDDGIGFDPEMLHSGYGLKGIQERVQLLGGKLMINSAPGMGTQILITLPLSVTPD